jgi:excisionase family DNA binding protein
MNEERRRQGVAPEIGSPAALGTTLAGLLDAEGVAQLLGVHVSWVRSATRSGMIPSIFLGRWVRYRRESIEAWLAELEQPGRPVKLRSAQPRRST